MQLGIPKVEDFNRGDNFGSSYFRVNQKRGSRWNTARGYLHPVMSQRANLTVLTKAQVTRVLFQGTRAVGIQYFREGRTGELSEALVDNKQGEVILASGAVNSPQLLLLSGVGPSDHLKAMEIPVHHELKGVGANLQDHL